MAKGVDMTDEYGTNNKSYGMYGHHDSGKIEVKAVSVPCTTVSYSGYNIKPTLNRTIKSTGGSR